MLAQLPIEETVKAAGTIIDTALVTSPQYGNGYGIALATPYIFLFVICGLFIYWLAINRRDKKEQEDKRDSESIEKREAFKDLRSDVRSIGDKFETRTKALEDALREDSTAIRSILNDHHTRISVNHTRILAIEARIGKEPSA